MSSEQTTRIAGSPEFDATLHCRDHQTRDQTQATDSTVLAVLPAASSLISQATNAQEAAAALNSMLSAVLVPVSAAVRQAIAAQGDLREAEDFLPVMQAAVGVILACEAMQAAAKKAEASARAALAEAMSLGATTIQAGLHTVSLRDAPRSAVVTDLALLPERFMVQAPQPPPKPDLTALRKALLDGPITGAQLSNGGLPTIAIRGAK